MKIIKTPMMKIYLVKLWVRVAIFLFAFINYLFYKDYFIDFLTAPIVMKIAPLHMLWFIFMAMMISHIFPVDKVTMALKKAQKEQYQEVEGYSELELYRYVKMQNTKAWQVMLVWLIFNSIFGILYLFGMMDEADLFMLTVFYFLCDYICILFYCPFQSVIMKNKCCINCRIYDWGHFMMFTPMLFIRDFFSWSLFFTSCIVLIHWEITYTRHPERFWEGSNKKLQCKNCNDKTCQIKKGLRKNL